MKKEDAEKLLFVVNNPEVLNAILFYVNYRIEKNKEKFLNAQTIEEVKAIQGVIEELKRFVHLRDEVNNPL